MLLEKTEFFCYIVDSSGNKTLNSGARCAGKVGLIWKSCQGRDLVEGPKSKCLSMKLA